MKSNKQRNFDAGYKLGYAGKPYDEALAKYTGYDDGWDAGNCDRPTLDELMPIDLGKETLDRLLDLNKPPRGKDAPFLTTLTRSETMTTTYEISYADGSPSERHATYAAALASVRREFGDDAITEHDGDLADYGDRTLCWSNEADSIGDDGKNAVASIWLED